MAPLPNHDYPIDISIPGTFTPKNIYVLVTSERGETTVTIGDNKQKAIRPIERVYDFVPDKLGSKDRIVITRDGKKVAHVPIELLKKQGNDPLALHLDDYLRTILHNPGQQPPTFEEFVKGSSGQHIPRLSGPFDEVGEENGNITLKQDKPTPLGLPGSGPLDNSSSNLSAIEVPDVPGPVKGPRLRGGKRIL